MDLCIGPKTDLKKLMMMMMMMMAAIYVVAKPVAGCQILRYRHEKVADG